MPCLTINVDLSSNTSSDIPFRGQSSPHAHVPETLLHLRLVSHPDHQYIETPDTYFRSVNEDLYKLLDPLRRLLHGMLLGQFCSESVMMLL